MVDSLGTMSHSSGNDCEGFMHQKKFRKAQDFEYHMYRQNVTCTDRMSHVLTECHMCRTVTLSVDVLSRLATLIGVLRCRKK